MGSRTIRLRRIWADQIGVYTQKQFPPLPYTEPQITAAEVNEELHLMDQVSTAP